MSRHPDIPHERIRRHIQVAPSGCWLWTASLDRDGYGRTDVYLGPNKIRRTIGAHRFAYETFIGPVPEGMTLDHLCHTTVVGECRGVCEHRRCVHPLHLEPVTMTANRFRSRLPFCGAGHDAWLPRKDGTRYCGECRRIYDRRRYAALVGAA